MFNVKKVLFGLIGSFFIGMGINHFLTPFHLLDGGMVGIALMINYVWNTGVGVAMLVLGIPIFLFIGRYHRPFLFNHLLGISLATLSLEAWSLVPIGVQASPVVHALLGGLLLGTGVGLMFLQDISMDSLDLLAQFIAYLFKLNVGIIIFLFDMFVLLIGYFVVDQEILILSLIVVSSQAFMVTLLINLAGKATSEHRF